MAQNVNAANPRVTPAQQVWLTHLRACEAQGCSSAAYARAHDLSLPALYGARKELTRRGVFKRARPGRRSEPGSPVTFVPVEMRPSAPARLSACVFRVVLPNGVVIEVPEQAEAARCQALVSALSGVSL